MRLVIIFMLSLLAGVLTGQYYLHRPTAPKVLAEEIAISPTPIPTLEPTITSTPTPTVTPTPKPRPTATPTPKPQPKYSQEDVYNFTNQFGGQYGVDPNVLRAIAVCETGFNPAGHNHQYAGLFQFDAQTWVSFRRMLGDPHPDADERYDAQKAIQTAAYMISKGYGKLWPNCWPR